MRRVYLPYHRKMKDIILMFLVPLSFCLLQGLAWHALLTYKLHLRMINKYDVRAFMFINNLALAVNLIVVVAIILTFYLIGKKIDFKENMLSLILLLFLGFYIGDVIARLMYLLTEFPLTTDLILSTLINVLLSERKFFIAFTGMAIGYIRSRL